MSCTLMVYTTVKIKTPPSIITVIPDRGVTVNMVNWEKLPQGCIPNVLLKSNRYEIIMETFDYFQTLKIKELLPPKFANNNWIDAQMASVIDGDSKCGVI